MIVTGLFSALTPARWAQGERTKWGWFGISCVAFLVIWAVLFTGGMRGTSRSLSSLVPLERANAVAHGPEMC